MCLDAGDALLAHQKGPHIGRDGPPTYFCTAWTSPNTTVVEQSVGGSVVSSTGDSVPPSTQPKAPGVPQSARNEAIGVTLALMLFPADVWREMPLLFFTTDIFAQAVPIHWPPRTPRSRGRRPSGGRVGRCLLTDRPAVRLLLVVSSIGCGLSMLSLSVLPLLERLYRGSRV